MTLCLTACAWDLYDQMNTVNETLEQVQVIAASEEPVVQGCRAGLEGESNCAESARRPHSGAEQQI